MFSSIVTVMLNPSFDVTISVDKIDLKEPVKSLSEDTCAAGKAVNVSKVLTAFGIDNVCVGIAGEQNYGIYLDMLTKDNVKHDFITVNGKIRENLTVVADNGEIFKLNRQGVNVSQNDLSKVLDKILHYCTENSLIVFAGSLPKGLSADSFKDMMLKIKANLPQAKLVVDTNVFSISHYEQIKPFIIKPNLPELSDIIGCELKSTEDAVSHIDKISKCATYTLVSCGGDGLICCHGNKIVKVTVPDVKVKSTVGAGDTTLAGFIYALSQNMPLTEATKFAAACGTASVTLEGTQTITKGLADAILKDTKI